MGYLDDLYAKVGAHKGSWLGLPDFGITEAYANEIVPGESDITNAVGSINDQIGNFSTVPSGGGGGGGGGAAGSLPSNYDELKAIAQAGNLNPSQKTEWDNLNTDTGGGGNDGGMSAQIALARGAYENAMRDLQSVFGQARGVYDEGIGNVGKIRDRATKSYNTGRDNILNRFEGERGNLQRESVGNADRLRGTMRALGMGGSAYVRGIGNNDKANARAIGSLRQSRGENELANTQQQTQSNDFANTQEGTLNRYLQQASRNLQSGQEKASLVNQGDVAGINSGFNDLRSNIFANQQALQAAGGAAAGYQVNPFAPNMASMIGSLNSGLPQFSGQQQAQGGNVNLGNENLTYLEKLQRGLL